MHSSSQVSPFGGECSHVERVHVAELVRRYKEKCGADISSAFGSIQFADLYLCNKTGYKFWLPLSLAGDEDFYKLLSMSWPNYYRQERWEYKYAKNLVEKSDACLEVGCGRGYFIKSIETQCSKVLGLELNNDAINLKSCSSKIIDESLSSHSTMSPGVYDKVFAFQLLEHLSDPKGFLNDCAKLLKMSGLLVVSVPNDDYMPHQLMQDPFNFPPHHMGSYNKSVFEKIGEMLDLELIEVQVQPPHFPKMEVSSTVANSNFWKAYSAIARVFGRFLLRGLGEPGHTMLVVYQKL